MRYSIKAMLAVVAIAINFLTVQAVWAGGPEPTEWDGVSGTVYEVNRESSEIVVESDDGLYSITGFPFGYLESLLDTYFENDWTVISAGDCVTVEYAVVVVRKTGLTKNIAVTLTRYCEGCGDVCYEDN